MLCTILIQEKFYKKLPAVELPANFAGVLFVNFIYSSDVSDFIL